jgi:ABC-type nitrate/sulfonate/bicarbonate transport system permease component
MPGTGQSKTAQRVRAISALLAVLAAIALIVVWFLSWTLLSHSDKYGRVNIPGETALHQVASDGDYRVVAAGQVGGYINPQLTFGSDTSVSGILIALGIATGALLALAIGAHLVVRRRRREAGALALE